MAQAKATQQAPEPREEGPEAVKEIMQAFFAEQDKKYTGLEDRPVSVFWPSEIYKCQRKIFYKRNGFKEEREAPHGLFESGRRAEAALLDVLKWRYGEDYVLTQVPVKVDKSIDPQLGEAVISGKADVVLLGRNLVARRVYECKSKAKVYPDDSPNIDHKAQLMVYNLALRPTEHGRLWYPERSNYDNNAEIEIPFDPVFWGQIVDWVGLMLFHLEEKALPPPGPLAPRECTYCSFQNLCLKDGPPEQVEAAFAKSRNWKDGV